MFQGLRAEVERPIAGGTYDLVRLLLRKTEKNDQLLQEIAFVSRLFAVGVREQRGIGQEQLPVFLAQVGERQVLLERPLPRGVGQELPLLVLIGSEPGQKALDDAPLGGRDLAVCPRHRHEGLEDVLVTRGHEARMLSRPRSSGNAKAFRSPLSGSRARAGSDDASGRASSSPFRAERHLAPRRVSGRWGGERGLVHRSGRW